MKIHKPGKTNPDPLYRLFEAEIEGKTMVVGDEPYTALRELELIPLLEVGGIEASIKREVLAFTPAAWVDESKALASYENSFTRHFYKPVLMSRLSEIKADIQNVEQETDWLLEQTVGAVR